ncbi:MAG: hypothetical protein ABIQ01_08560 [Pseudolysinimonas sp.]
MSVEENVSQILANLEGRRPDHSWQQAAAITEGIRGSGVIDSINSASDRMQTNLAGLAGVLGVSVQVIASEISTSNRYLGMVVDSLRGPRATAANERFRAGLTALQKGWRPEAIEELQESIKLFRFHAPAHASLGHALAAEGRFGEAAESYALGQRYALPDGRAFAAGCALLLAAALEDAGDRVGAEQALKDASEAMPEAAEVGLAYSRLSGDVASLRRALTIAPELIVAALAAGVANVDEVADELAHGDSGPVAVAARFIRALDTLRAEFPDTVVDPPLPSIGDQPAVDEVIAAATILAVAGPVIVGLRAQQDRRRSGRVEAQRDMTQQSIALTRLTPDLPATPYQDELSAVAANLRELGACSASLKATIEQRTERYRDAKEKGPKHVGGFWREPEFPRQGRVVKLLYLTHFAYLKHDGAAFRGGEPGAHVLDALWSCLDPDVDPDDRPALGDILLSIDSVTGVVLIGYFDELRKLGITEPRATAAQYQQEWEEFFTARGAELMRELEEVKQREEELGMRATELRPNADAEAETIRLEQEAERARLDVEQEAERARLDVERETERVHDSRWDELLSTVEGIAGLAPVRLVPWQPDTTIQAAQTDH